MNKSLPKLVVPLPISLDPLKLSTEALGLVAGAKSAAEGLDRLLAAKLTEDAIRLVSHTLPKREAVWWCCMCARSVPAPLQEVVDLEALQAAEAWVRRPSEEARRACMTLAQKTKFNSPEIWAAVGAFWTGGSMGPESAPAIPVPEHFTGLAVHGGVMLASVRLRPENAMARLGRFLTSAQEIASGGAGVIAVEEA